MRIPAAALALVVSAVALGCGGEPSDEEQVAEVANAFLAAIRDRNPAAMCETLSDRGQRVIGVIARAELPDRSLPSDCLGRTSALLETLDRERSAGFLSQEFSPLDVTFDEDGRAYARCETRGAFSASLVSDEWRLDAPGCFD